MRISLWSIANWLKALGPKSPTLRVPGKPRLAVQRRLSLVGSGDPLGAESTGAGRTPHRAAPGQSPRVVVRVLIALEDARIRDAYRRILVETDVNHDIAAFRELRPRTKSFEVICCGGAEEAVALAQEAAVQQRPFAIAFIGVEAPVERGRRPASGKPIRPWKSSCARPVPRSIRSSLGVSSHRKTNCLICRAILRRARSGR